MTSMHPFSFSFFSEANSVGIRASAWSSMLTIFREHFRDRTETELNRQSSAGRNGDASERASRTSLCLDLESTALHLQQAREHVFLSWQPSFPNTAAKHSQVGKKIAFHLVSKVKERKKGSVHISLPSFGFYVSHSKSSHIENG